MNDMINININGVRDVTVNKGIRLLDIVNQCATLLDNPCVGATINNEIVSFDSVINKDCNLVVFDKHSINGYKMYQAGLKFLLGSVLKKLYGSECDIRFNNSINNGVHANIVYDKVVTKEDIDTIKEEMNKLVDEDLKFIRLNVNSKEAFNFYEKLGYYEKAENIHNISNQIVALYKLNNYINYFYVDMPYSTKCLNDFDIIYINDNEILLMFSSDDKNAYENYMKVIDCYKKSHDWLVGMDVPYVSTINKIITNSKFTDLIRTSEIDYNNRIYEVAKDVIAKNTKFLLLAGPSSSGKTTTAKKFMLTLKSMGLDPMVISIDDYFVNKDDTPLGEDGQPDFECLEAIDIETFNKDLNDLLAGKEVDLPRYNFVLGKREYNGNHVKLSDNGIIVMEGLHTLNDKLIPSIDKSLMYRVYLSPFIAVNIDRHNYISSTDLRLIRRIIRDNNNRGYDVSKTIDIWQKVRRGEEKNIFPYMSNADTVLNTALPYELSVLKIYATPLLFSITNDSPYYEEARRLIYFLRNFFPISSEYVDEESIIREFIGGSVFRNEGDK